MQFAYEVFTRSGVTVNDVAGMGFDYVEVHMNWPWSERFDAAKLRRELHDTGLGVAFHAPWMDVCLANPDPIIWAAALKAVKKSLAIAEKFDSLYFVTHLGANKHFRYEKPLPARITGNARRAYSLLRKSEVPVLAENGINLLSYVEEYRGCDMCLDTGHAVLVYGSDVGIKKYVDAFGRRIKALHLHDVILPDRDHRAFGDGDLDHKKIFGWLRRTGAEYANLETFFSKDEKSLSKEKIAKGLKFCKRYL